MMRFFVVALFVLSLCFASAQSLRVGLGYLPDVQFAPFYLGVMGGLYEEAGLEVEFQHGFVTELYPLLAQGKLDFVVGDAEDIILLRSQDEEGAAFKYLMALYQNVPNALFSLEDAEITDITDLAGKRVGIPGLFGTSYTSLQAILQAANLSEDDIILEQIGFTQVEAVLSGRVDVAMGFINNEPIVLEAQGLAVNVIPAGDYNPSAGNGVVTTETMLANPDLVQRFVQASQRAMALTVREPELAFEAAHAYVENMGDDRMAVLLTSADLYTSELTDENGIGYTDLAGWEATLELLKANRRVDTELDASAFFTNEFIDPTITAE